MSKRDEPIRHINKTEQDKLPAHLRQRVKDAQARIDAMRSRGVREVGEIVLHREGDATVYPESTPIKETR